MDIWFLIVVMTGIHFLADYPLQGDYLARVKNHRNKDPYCPWFYGLFAHSFIHTLFVTLILQNVILGLLELISHMVIDYLKCDDKIDYMTDQFLHLTCKYLWVFLYITFVDL